MVPLLVPEVFPPVDFSMQAHVFFGDTGHHPYISTCFCGKRFYFPVYGVNLSQSGFKPEFESESWRLYERRVSVWG